MQRKIITFTSIILMALTAFTGCSSLQKNYDPDNFLLNGTDDNPYRIVKNPVTIKKTKTKYKKQKKKQNPQITYFAQTHIPHIKSKELK